MTDITVVRSLEAFIALGAEWDGLAAPRGWPLLAHDWFLSCARTLHAERDLRVVIVREHGVLAAAAPLVIRRQRGVERLELLGMAVLHEPSGLLYRSEAALETLLRAVLTLGRPVVLQRIDLDSPLERLIRQVVGRNGWTLARPTGPTVRVPLEADWSIMVGRVSGKLRKWQRRAWALAEAQGPVTVEKVVPDLENVEAHVRAFSQLEAAGWKGRRRSALLTKQALHVFFGDYARRAAARGTLRVWYLRIGAALAAAQISLEENGAVWVLKIAYDERLRHLSPGFQLTFAMLKDACERGLGTCEFLGSADDWKRRWRGSLQPLGLVLVYPRSWRGLAALGVDGAAHAANAAARRIREVTAAPRAEASSAGEGESA